MDGLTSIVIWSKAIKFGNITHPLFFQNAYSSRLCAIMKTDNKNQGGINQ